MTFGDMNIFHRTVDGSDKPAFSMANAVKPGFFDKEAWNTFETTGLALFLTLPGPTLALDGWDAMLATARRMSEILKAELHDSDHTPFTRQKEAEVREEMRLYDRSKARQTFV
jgi:cell division protein ZipA